MARHSNSCTGGGGCARWEPTTGGRMEFANNVDNCSWFFPSTPFIDTSTIDYYITCYRSGTVEIWQSGNNAFWDKTILYSWPCSDSNPHHIGSFSGINGKRYSIQLLDTSNCGTGSRDFTFTTRSAECLEYNPTCNNSCYIDDLEVRAGRTANVVYNGALDAYSSDIAVLENGVIRALKPGTATLRVRTQGCCSASATATLTVTGKYQTISLTNTDLKVLKNIILQAKSVGPDGENTGLTNFTYSCDSPYVTITGSTFYCTRRGIYTIKIDQAGDDTWIPATVEVAVTVGGDVLTPELSRTTFYVGEAVTMIPSIQGSPTLEQLGDVTVISDATDIFTVSKLGTWPTFNLSAIKYGSGQLQIKFAGGTIYDPSTTYFNIVVDKRTQVLTTTLPSGMVPGIQYTITSSSTSGLTAFTYSCDSSYAHISGNKITFDRKGSYTVVTSQAGNASWHAASIRTVVSVQGKQNSISIATTVFDVGTYIVIPTVLGDKDSAGDITVQSLDTNLADVSKRTVWPTFTLNAKKSGIVTIRISLAGGNVYDAITKDFQIRIKKVQVLRMEIPPMIVGIKSNYNVTSYDLNGSPTGLTNITISASSELMIIGIGFLLCQKIGVYTITASSPGNDDYSPAEATATVVVSLDNLEPNLIET